MMRRCAKLVTLSLLVGACAKAPASYEDCILQKVRAGMSDGAVRLVTFACREKFPEIPPHLAPGLESVPTEVRGRLTGHLVPSFVGRTWTGNLYNANEDWAIEEGTFQVCAKRSLEELTEDRKGNIDWGVRTTPEPERYRVAVHIPPLTSQAFSLDVNWSDPTSYEWYVLSARGRRVAEFGIR